MHIIPVIDLLDGRAVLARGGRRDRYRPLATPLCADPDPLSVAAAYLSLHPFRTFYVADLNAIQGTGDNQDSIRALLRRFRSADFWLDAGRDSMDRSGRRLRPVIGTETGIAADELRRLAGRRPSPVLSLDFTAQGPLGDASIAERPECWPWDVIIMNLPKVGSGSGPDLERLALLRALAPRKRFYAGGGLRHEQDLRLLAAAGATGVLVATALHARALEAGAIARWNVKKKPRPGPGRVVG